MHCFQTESPRKLAAVWIVCLAPLAASGCIVLFAANFQSQAGERSAPLGSDFLQEWVGGSMVAAGESQHLYDSARSRLWQHDRQRLGFDWNPTSYYPMVYPPFYYAFVAPLSALDYSTAARIWVIGLGLSLSLSFFLLSQFARDANVSPLILLPALAYSPLLLSLAMGQKSSIVLLVLVATYCLLRRQRNFLAGIVFGALAFKPHLMLIIGLMFILKNQRRFVWGMFSTLMVTALISLGMGVGVCIDFLKFVTKFASYGSNGGYQTEHAHNLWGALSTLFPNGLGGIFYLGIVGLIIWVLLRTTMAGPLQTGTWRFARQWSSLILATVLCAPHFYTYDLTVLVFPFALVAIEFYASLGLGSPVGVGNKGGWQALIWGLAAWMFAGVGVSVSIAHWAGFHLTPVVLALWLYAWNAAGDPAFLTEPKRRANEPAAGGRRLGLGTR